MKNTLILLEHWREHFLKKNVGLSILSTNDNYYVYCNKILNRTDGINFIGNRVSKQKHGFIPTIIRGFKIFYILKQYKIDKVNWAYISDDELFFICLYKKILKKNLFICVKTDSEDITSNRFFKLKLPFFQNIDRLFVETLHFKSLYSRFFINIPVKILYNPSFLELNNYKPKKENSKVSNLLFVGRISKEKNLKDFLNISYKFYSNGNHTSVKLLLLEDDSDYWENEILPLIRKFRMYFEINYVINATVNEMYQSYFTSDVLCITSLIEGVPNVISDAYYMNLPVLSYRVGNIPNLLNNDKIIAENLDDFVSKLESLQNRELFTEIINTQNIFYTSNMSMDVFKKLI